MRRFLLLTASLLPLAAFAQTPAPAPARPAWAHQASDLAVDPAVRFGQLPNGMRYAIMKNATPPGEASLRLRIDAGSLNEREDQRGGDRGGGVRGAALMVRRHLLSPAVVDSFLAAS